MSNPERTVVKLGVSPESLQERVELRAARFALDREVDVEYIFGGQTFKVTLEEAIKAYSPEKTGQRIEDLGQDLKRDTDRFLRKAAWIESEVEEEKKYAKLASEID